MSDPHYEAHVHSTEADNATHSIDKRFMFSTQRPGASTRAFNHSYGQRHLEAAQEHESAAKFHAKQAGLILGSGLIHPVTNSKIGRETGKLHKKAAELHKKAAASHKALADQTSQHSEIPMWTTSNLDSFKKQASSIGLDVKEMTHPSGEGTHHVAMDKEGNHHGSFDPKTKAGHLKHTKLYSQHTELQFCEGKAPHVTAEEAERIVNGKSAQQYAEGPRTVHVVEHGKAKIHIVKDRDGKHSWSAFVDGHEMASDSGHNSIESATAHAKDVVSRKLGMRS